MEKPQFLTQTRFNSFDIPNNVLTGLDEMGLVYCSPIQAQTLPISLSGKDVAGQAQTGTGKTAAFLITVFSRLLAMEEPPSKNPQALIMAPTRELATQIFDEARQLGMETPFRLVSIVGGVDYAKQAQQLKNGVDIIIGTPGRIIDYYKKKILITDDIKIVVIDEADRLLDLGFAKDMRYILKNLPHYEKRQSMLFSATLSYSVMELTYEYMNLPEFVSVTSEDVAVEGVEQSLYHVGNDKKFSLLLGILANEEWVRMIIFVNTKVEVDRLTKRLKGNKWPAEGITGDLPQKKRFRLMEQFKSGKLKILVATDVASRGIHVENISHVVNYDLPQDAENYVHRIGRTARAGNQGKAISLACEKYVFHLEAMEEMLGEKIPVVWPEEDWFVQSLVPDPVDSRSRRRPDRKKTNPRANPRTNSRSKSRGQSHPRSRETISKTFRNTYPGSFFGFAPPSEQSKPEQSKPEQSKPEQTKPAQAKPEQTEAQPKKVAPKKRRPRRYRKKQAAPAPVEKSSAAE